MELVKGQKAISVGCFTHHFKDGAEITFIEMSHLTKKDNKVFIFEGVMDNDELGIQHLIESEFELVEDLTNEEN